MSHYMYCMKRAVHKISQSEIINDLFFFCFSPSVFMPHPQGRKLSMVLYAAFWLYCPKRAVHKIPQSKTSNIFLMLKPIRFKYLIPKAESYHLCCMQPLGEFVKTIGALLCHIPCVVI